MQHSSPMHIIHHKFQYFFINCFTNMHSTLKSCRIRCNFYRCAALAFLESIFFVNSEPPKTLFGVFLFGLFFLGASSFGVPLCLVFLFTIFFGGVSFNWEFFVSISIISFCTKIFTNFCGLLGIFCLG